MSRNLALEGDTIESKVEKVTSGKAKDIINFVPYFGTSILPAIWLEMIKNIPNNSIAKLKSDSSIDSLFIFHGVTPK